MSNNKRTPLPSTNKSWQYQWKESEKEEVENLKKKDITSPDNIFTLVLGVGIIGLGALLFNTFFASVDSDGEEIKVKSITADYDNTVYHPEEEP